jgi:exopolyphosphatase/guanosine-5'-triphosphate,3'-diphosphate pyrophosphatase
MPAAPRVAAFMDIGTNSVRLLLVRLNANHTHTVLTSQKEVVRLGENEFSSGQLQPDAMRRAALVCRKFAELARSHGARDITAVATSATRDAENQQEFLARLKREAGLDVRVVAGKEEARLVYLGVSSGAHLGAHKALFIDIGGGSAEVIVGDQRRHFYLDMLKLGAIRLTTLFLPGETGPVSAERYALIQRFARNACVRAAQSVAGYKIEQAYGSSGTILNLADITARAVHGRPRGPDDSLGLADLRATAKLLCSLPLEKRRGVPGINPERADIIIAGAAALETLMAEFGVAELRLSERGLREGLLADYLARSQHSRPLAGLSVRERSVLQLGRACGFDEAHARTVTRLALELFDTARAAGLHGLGGRERELLEHAAMLHDIGAFLAYNSHHAHSYYLIRHADLLGFDQNDIALVAATAFFHRKAMPRKKHPEFASLSRDAQAAVRVLCLLLRVAESLDRSHSGLVRSARLIRPDKTSALLRLRAAGECELEIWSAENHAGDFETVFGRGLRIEARIDPSPAKARRHAPQRKPR